MTGENSRDRLAFIDHSYHQQSRASDFLVDLLRQRRPVDLYWDDSWRGGPAVDLTDLAARGYRDFLFFQVTKFTAKDLAALEGCSVTVVPMYDDFPLLRHRAWARLAGKARLRFVSFCRALHERLLNQGLQSRHGRYWPPPENLPSPFPSLAPDELRGFFWQRTKWLTWNHVRRLLGDSPFRSFTIHGAVDPGFTYVPPSAADMDRYGIEQTDWFEDRGDYYKKLSDATVFFAPRRAEGIGMSFLEAMAMGKCVVAHDGPTMNEYIVHGETGLLYNARRPRPLDFSGHAAIGREARRRAEEGRREWVAALADLAAYIEG